jgi:hypothetical protein
MIARAVDWGLLSHAEYTALDADAGAVDEIARFLPAWAATRGLRCAPDGDGALVIEGDRAGGVHVVVRPVHADLFAFDAAGQRWDLLIAHAVLDLVDVPRTLPQLWRWLAPGAHFWFTINFDGETIFSPEVDPAFEARVLELYHRSMDERVIDGRPSGDSRTGRNLFPHLEASGATILAAGASDWVVHPIAGAYPADEGAFLHHIIDTIDEELRDHPALERERFAAWLAARRRQIDDGRLILIAHQLDFFGRAPAG